MVDWKSFSRELERWVAEGKSALVAKSLREREGLKHIPRAYAASIANSARKAGRPAIAVRILNPFVRGDLPRGERATDWESFVYAAALIRIDALEEGSEILATLDGRDNPDVLLFRSHALVARWDYKASIPVLTTYLAHPRLTESQHIMGKLNLAAAYVHCRDYSPALNLLDELRTETRERGLNRFYGNTLELSAQLALDVADWAKARASLKAARALLVDHPGLDNFFVRKWEAILDFSEGARDDENSAALKRFRAEAVKLGHWESVRDCDLVLAVGTRDTNLAIHLYFGTSFESFRRMIFERVNTRVEIPATYRWYPCEARGDWPVVKPSADPLLPHRLFSVLTSDFYRPFRVPALYARLYPHEYFNPISSPLRVHQALRALRKTLAHAKVPLVIAATRYGYAISAQSRCAVEIRRRPSSEAPALETLSRTFGERAFSARDAEKMLALPGRTVSRLLKAAVDERTLERTGAGQATTYQFRPKRLSNDR